MEVSLNNICKAFGIRSYSYQGEPEFLEALGLKEHSKYSDGFAVCYEGTPIILFNEDMPDSCIRRVAAHEIGHHVLGHLTSRFLFWQAHGDSAEREADIFAMMLLLEDVLPL